MGVPSVFIRTSGCNLRCSWCDTPYTSWQPEGAELPLERILDEVRAHPARHVVVTGGEPMIAPEMLPLTAAVARRGLAHHHRDRRHGVPSGGLRPDEHQPQAVQLHAGRPVGGAARAPAHSAGRSGGVDGAVRLSAQVRDRPAGRPGGSASAVPEPRGRRGPRDPDAGRHGRRAPARARPSGWPKSASRRASASARACTSTCTATAEECEYADHRPFRRSAMPRASCRACTLIRSAPSASTSL